MVTLKVTLDGGRSGVEGGWDRGRDDNLCGVSVGANPGTQRGVPNVLPGLPTIQLSSKVVMSGTGPVRSLLKENERHIYECV